MENVNEGKGCEFWRLLGGEGPEGIEDDDSKNILLEGAEAFEIAIARTNIVFEVLADYTICPVSAGVVPSFSIFRPDAVRLDANTFACF